MWRIDTENAPAHVSAVFIRCDCLLPAREMSLTVGEAWPEMHQRDGWLPGHAGEAVSGAGAHCFVQAQHRSYGPLKLLQSTHQVHLCNSAHPNHMSMLRQPEWRRGMEAALPGPKVGSNFEHSLELAKVQIMSSKGCLYVSATACRGVPPRCHCYTVGPSQPARAHLWCQGSRSTL